MPRIRLWLPLLLLPAQAWPQLTLFDQSVELYKQRRYQEAMRGFVGVIVEEPRNARAREYLALAGRALKEQESAAAEEERRRLIQDIDGLKHDGPLREKWRDHLRRALKLARDKAGACFSLPAYEEALRTFPVESGQLADFRRAKSRFYEAFWASHWRDGTAPGADAGRVVMHDGPKEEETLRRIRDLEEGIEQGLKDAERRRSERSRAL